MTKKILLSLFTSLILLTCFSAFPPETNAQPKKAKNLFQEGEKLFKRQNYQQAIAKSTEAIQLAPNYADAHFLRGYSHFNLNQYDEAIQDLDAALAQGFREPVRVYILRWQSHYQKKNYDSAASDLREAIKLDPSNAAFNKNLGDVYFIKQDWREALNAYKAWVQQNQTDADVYYFMAYSHYRLGETAPQEVAALEAVRRGTKYMGDSYFIIGDALQKIGRYDEAITAYKNALNAKADIYDAYLNLGDSYRNQNRFGDAIDIANKGLSLFPNDGNLYISLSWYYSLADRHQDAINAGLNAVKYAPNVSMGYTNLCRAYNDTKQYQLAIQTCNNALKINPNDGETNFYLGRAHDFLDKSDQATRYYKKAVTGLIEFTGNNPNYSDGFYLLGNAYYADGQRDEAIKAYQRALIISPRFAKARYNLAYMYFLNKETALAQRQYEELKKIDPATAEKLRQAMEKK